MLTNADLNKRLIHTAKLDRMLANLFFKLQRVNWVRHGNLGMARQKALDQIKSYLDTMDPVHPVVVYLKSAAAKHRNRWAQSIMQSRRSNEICRLTEPEKASNIPKLDAQASAALGDVKRAVKEYTVQKDALIQTFVALKQAEQEKAEMQLMLAMFAKDLDRAVTSQEKARRMIEMFAHGIGSEHIKS